MSLQIICGKPGSGKSYHCVTMLMQYLEDWVQFEKKNAKPFERSVYTNLPLRIDVINKRFSKMLGSEVDVSHYVHMIDENLREQFKASYGQFPLASIPEKSLIVIDEVHKMFGAELEGSKFKDFEVKFRNYIAQHRHYGHDLIFLTQHTDNIAKSIIAIADKLYQIENAKSYSFPFPINIPFSDLDVVKEAFGIQTQFYTVNVGKYQGRRAKFDGESTRHFMSQEVFACYSSHTLSDVTSDRPSLNLTKSGAIFWFIKRHAFHIVSKVLISAVLVYYSLDVIRRFPTIMTNTLVGSLMKSPLDSPTKQEPEPKKVMPPSPPPVPNQKPLPFPPPPGQLASPKHICTDPACTHDHGQQPLPPSKSDDRIVGIYPYGLMTMNGRKSVGDKLIINGNEEKIMSINVRKGLVLLESKKEIRVPK